MANTASVTASQHAEQELKNALDDFRSALTDKWKRELDANVKTASEYTSATYVTNEIDHINSKGIGRNLGPKLLPFLDGVKAFTSVVDTFVQSNPETAALVWGSIKLCLFSVCNWAEYFTKLTNLLHFIGELSPTYREFGDLFDSHQGLQDALVYYYAAVIRIFIKAVKAFQRSAVKHVALSIIKSFDSEYTPLRDEVQRRARQIRLQVTLATSRVQDQEAKYNQVSRRQIDSIAKILHIHVPHAVKEIEELRRWELERRQRSMRKDRETVKDNLSRIDTRTAWRRTKRQCVPETSDWFEDDDAFVQWKSQNASSTLIYTANLGSGKTTLTANIIGSIVRIEGMRSGIAHFLCQPSDVVSSSARSIFGCIVRQLLESLIDSSQGDLLEGLLTRSRGENLESMISLLMDYLPKGRPCFVFLDGLDDLDLDVSLEVLGAIAELLKPDWMTETMKVFVTVRPDRAKTVDVLRPTYAYTLRPTSEHINQSVSRFIEHTILEKLDSEELLPQDPEMVLIIQHVVTQGAQGMYLWAKLLIANLCLIRNDRELLEALDDIKVPVELAEIYDRILRRLESDYAHRDRSSKLFMWAIGSMRVLSTDEMREAISLESGQQTLDPKLLPDMTSAIRATGGLTYQDPDDNTVHAIHSSFAQYLFHGYQEVGQHSEHRRTLFDHDRLTLNAKLFIAVATYLNFTDFKKSLVKWDSSTGNAPAPQDVVHNVTDQGGKMVSMVAKARNFLHRARDLSPDAHRKQVDEASRRIKAKAMESEPLWQPALLNYAGRAWLYHGANLDATAYPEAWRAFEELVGTTDHHVSKEWVEQYGKIPALGAGKQLSDAPPPKEVSVRSEYFSSSNFSEETLALIHWSFSHGNPALLAIVQPSDGAKLHSSRLSNSSIINLLNSVINLANLSPVNHRRSMAEALCRLFSRLDVDSLHTQVVEWYAAALFDWKPEKAANPINWRSLCVKVKQLADMTGIPLFETPNPAISDTGKQTGLCCFQKHQTWADFQEIPVHPMMLAAILDSQIAYCSASDVYTSYGTNDPFEMKHDPYDIKLDSLWYAILADRSDYCLLILRSLEAGGPSVLRGKADRVAKIIKWASIRGMPQVAQSLLDLALVEQGSSLLSKVLVAEDDSGNSLLFYFIEFRNVYALWKLLTTREENAKLKSPTTTAGKDLLSYTQALIQETSSQDDNEGNKALEEIYVVIEKHVTSAVGRPRNDSILQRIVPVAYWDNDDKEIPQKQDTVDHEETVARNYSSSWHSVDSFDPPSPDEVRELRLRSDSGTASKSPSPKKGPPVPPQDNAFGHVDCEGSHSQLTVPKDTNRSGSVNILQKTVTNPFSPTFSPSPKATASRLPIRRGTFGAESNPGSASPRSDEPAFSRPRRNTISHKDTHG